MARVSRIVTRVVGPVQSELERRKAVIAVSVSMFLLCGAPMFLIVDLVLQNRVGIALNLMLCGVCAVCLTAIRAGRRRVAEWVLIVSLTSLANLASFLGEGVESSSFSVNAVVVLFAAVLLRGPGVLFALGCAAVSAAASPWALHWTTLSLEVDIFFWVAILSLMALSVYSLVVENERAIADATRKAEQLGRLVDELEHSRVSRSYMEGVMGALSELILVTNADQVVECVEGDIPPWSGWDPVELMGMSIVRLFDGVDLQHPDRSRDVVHLRSDGIRVPVVVTRGSVGSSFVWAATDVTALASTTVALRQAHDRARAASAAKSGFLANMSHELRTPLNAILGYSELLVEEVEDPGQLEDLGRIGRAALSLLDLINGVLDLSKIEAGQTEFRQEHVDLADVVVPALAAVRPAAVAKGLTLQVRGEGVDGEPIYTDAGKLGQILGQLLTNAVKFTDAGGIELWIERWERSRLPWLRLVVLDSGIGMAQADLDVAFEPFTQASEGADGRSGTGLGLAICRAYVEMLGGQIYAESESGKGSRFVVELPVAKYADLTPRSSLPLPDGVESLQRVLVIDDDPEFLEFAGRVLHAEGRQVVCTADPLEALDWANRFVADLILVDIAMPILNGWAFVVRLRDTRSASSPVLVVSGDADREVADALGCSGLMIKPVASKELAAMVDSLAHRGGA